MEANKRMEKGDPRDEFRQQSENLMQKAAKSSKDTSATIKSYDDLLKIRQSLGLGEYKNDFSKRRHGQKNAPMEMTSKKKPRPKQLVDGIQIRKPRDPRFVEEIPALDNKQYLMESYSFLKDYRSKEIEELNKRFKETADYEEKSRIGLTLKSFKSREETQERKRKADEALKEYKKKATEVRRAGGNPLYLKKAEQKRIIEENWMEGLTQKQREKSEWRKEKRKTGKEKKLIPR